jgi:hypothetical protein
MMSLTTDPNDPRIKRGQADIEPGPQNEVYLVLSEAERAKGFVRPYRDTYQHVGIRPKYPTRQLTAEEVERHGANDYVCYEPYPQDGTHGSALGRFWTRAQLNNSGCGAVTKMGRALSETYARDPKFYGATYCVGCQMHRPVQEFVWDKTTDRVGS